MIEAALLVIIAGGLWMVTSQFRKRDIPAHPGETQLDRMSLTVIAEGGLYQLATPADAVMLRAFRSLHLIEGGLRLQDNQNQQYHAIDFASIQWVSAVNLREGIASISLHVEVARKWRILTLQIPEADMAVLVKLLQKALNPSRMNIGHRDVSPIGPLNARISEDTLQGESITGAEVSLYLLPHMLIVLKGDVVQAKLDTSSIRRVLSVERISGRLDALLNPNMEGVIRLYSLYESVAFALPQYRELAEEIAFIARCPVEFITQEDKTGKI